MNFDFTAEENRFRDTLRAWLDQNAPALLADGPQYADPEKRWQRAMRWHKALFDAGWVGIYWPREYGGRGATLVEQYIHEEEMDRINAPGTINPVGLNIAGPTIMQWGTDEMKHRYLPPILSGDEIWCQGIFRTGCRFRCRIIDHPRGRSRRLLCRQWTESVDHARASRTFLPAFVSHRSIRA